MFCRSAVVLFSILRPGRSLVTKQIPSFFIPYRPFSLSPYNMAKTALVVIAEGSEEMEAVITVDVLRRAGVEVTFVGLYDESPVKCSRQITIVPDTSFDAAVAVTRVFDAIILPGGLGGSERLGKCPDLRQLLKEQEAAGRIIAAICAAPTALKAHGIGLKKRVTSYPTTKEQMMEGNLYTYVEGEAVVIDNNLVTSRGPGTAFAFGLALAELLVGKEKADSVGKGMMLSGY